MAMINVLRVENESGEGPYRAEHVWEMRLCEEHADEDHPSPWGIGEPWECEPWECEDHRSVCSVHFLGFLYREQFEAWFDAPWRERLGSVGFRLVTYAVDDSDVLIGVRQISFVQHRATVIDSQPL